MVCVCVCDGCVDLTGGTAAAQASDSWAVSSPPPSAPAAGRSLPSAAAPPRSPGTALVSRDDALGSGDTDMASSAVVAAAGDRLSPFCRWNESRNVRGCGAERGP